MKKPITLIFLIILALNSFSQDIDIYQKKKNSNYELPYLNSQTSFEEFQLLNRTLRLQDMAYAAVVPGYVHFKVKEPIVGYSMVALRTAGYGGILYILNDGSFSLTELINNSPSSSADVDKFNQQKTIAYASLGLIFSTYLFDWIHGKHRLEKKQERIRYKYGVKLNLAVQTDQSGNFNQPMLGVRVNF
ncbi:MAG: hypothetical protein JW729_09850 [Bacteroidales bacterium]|nr:hypothetical protein [Bacteroidales bacterium]